MKVLEVIAKLFICIPGRSLAEFSASFCQISGLKMHICVFDKPIKLQIELVNLQNEPSEFLSREYVGIYILIFNYIDIFR